MLCSWAGRDHFGVGREGQMTGDHVSDVRKVGCADNQGYSNFEGGTL